MSLEQDLPEYIDPRAVEALIDELADAIRETPALVDACSKCELEPTTRAAGLAARAAVMVLIAHNLAHNNVEIEDYVAYLEERQAKANDDRRDVGTLPGVDVVK